MEAVVHPESFGLTFNPPSITLVYRLDDKLRERARPFSRTIQTAL